MAAPSAAPPTVTSVTYDKVAYPKGDTITATVTYTPGTSLVSFTGTGTVTDSASGQTAQGAATFQVDETDPALATGFTDTGGRNWVKKSDTGAVAVWTAVA
jgi:hypothetical protein